MEKVSLVSKVKSHCFGLDLSLPPTLLLNWLFSLFCTFNVSVWFLPITISTGYSPTLREKRFGLMNPHWSSYILLFKYLKGYLFFLWLFSIFIHSSIHCNLSFSSTETASASCLVQIALSFSFLTSNSISSEWVFLGFPDSALFLTCLPSTLLTHLFKFYIFNILYFYS